MRIKLKRTLALAISIAMLVSVTCNVNAASSSVVGEYVAFHSGGVPDSVSGSSTVTTLTEEQRQANSTNSTTSRSIQTKTGQILSEYSVEEGYTIQKDGSYIFVIDQSVDWDKLKELVEKAASYNPIGYGFRIREYVPGNPVITQEDKDIFRNVVSNRLGGSGSVSGLEMNSGTSPIIRMDTTDGEFVWRDIQWTRWQKDGFGGWDEFIEWLKSQGGEAIRIDIDGGFIDFTDMKTRYEMLDAYLNATSVTDTVDVQYVLEYRIESTAHDTVYRMVGQNGLNSYVWNFRNRDTGETFAKYDMPASITHQFMRAGTYDIDVNKEVYKTFCDAFTMSINEYWIIEETGQVIWKRETTGKSVSTTTPAVEQGHSNMVMYNTPAANEILSIETIDVATMTHTVTADMISFTIPAEGSFREFYTNRTQ